MLLSILKPVKLSPTLRLDVLSLPVECILHVSNHRMFMYYVVYDFATKQMCVIYSPEVYNRLEVTSHLILRLDRVYACF